MTYLNFLTAVLSLFAILDLAVANNPERTLKATRRKASLQRRGLDCHPRLGSTDLVYVDEESLWDASPFGARVSFDPKLPTLFLDDVEHIVSHVSCEDMTMFISFHTSEAKENAYTSWMQHSSFLVVTSVSNCARSGAHQMFRVSSVTDSEDGLVLFVEETLIKENVHRYRVQFGSHIYDELIRDDHSLKLRAVDDRNIVKREDIKSFATNPGFPTSTANAPDDAPTEVSQNIEFSYKKTTILPPDSSIADAVGSLAPDSPLHVVLTCVDCTSQGKIELDSGDIDVDTDNETGLKGYLNLKAQGVKTHIEMALKLELGFAEEFVASLPPIPIPFLSLGGVGVVFGVTFVPEIVMGLEFNAEIDFFTGFEVEVPDNSKIHLNFGDPSKSFERGFTNAKLKALPFNVHTPPPVLKFFAGFQPHIQLGADFTAADANVGMYLDSPRMQVTITGVNGTNEQCEQTNDHPVDHSLIHVVPKAVVDVVAYVEAEAAAFTADVPIVIAKTSYPLPTACLDFDSDTNNLVPAGGSKSGAVLQALGGYRGCRELLIGGVLFITVALGMGWM